MSRGKLITTLDYLFERLPAVSFSAPALLRDSVSGGTCVVQALFETLTAA